MGKTVQEILDSVGGGEPEENPGSEGDPGENTPDEGNAPDGKKAGDDPKTPPDGVDDSPFKLPKLPDAAQVVPFPTPVTPTPAAPAASELSELTEAVKEIQNAQVKNQTNDAVDAKLSKIESDIRAKYGEADPAVVQEFSDVINAVKQSVVANLEIATQKAELLQTTKIEALEAQISKLEKRLETAPAKSKESSGDDYLNAMVDAHPKFAEMLHHPNFKWLIQQPVDPLDPNRTWDHAIGDMLSRRSTSDILKFTDSFHAQYNKEAPATAPTQQTGQQDAGDTSASVQKAMDLLEKDVAGEIRLDLEDRKKLTELVRKAAVADATYQT